VIAIVCENTPDSTSAVTAGNRRVYIVAVYDIQDYLATAFNLGDRYQTTSPASTLYLASAVSDRGPVARHQLTPPNHGDDLSPPPKRQRVAGPETGTEGTADPVSQMPAPEGADIGETAAANKPRRVRTGCLTCRERHLKCDEGLPNCHNCQKSSRVCKRGVRLNFIDTTVKSHPLLPPTGGWKGLYHPASTNPTC
jgi:hypothetical protein